MAPQEFARLESSFPQFHAFFALAFGRQRWRERSRDYLRGLLVQSQERGNAENLAEIVEEASPRVLQRFHTEAKWADRAVTRQLPITWLLPKKRWTPSLTGGLVDRHPILEQGSQAEPCSEPSGIPASEA